MTNKEMINKLRDNAELAQASYGYFDLIGKKFDNNDKCKDRKNTEITLHDILDITYKGYETEDSSFFNTFELKGDFSPTQVKRFFERYDLLIHQPNTESGFSATLFYDKQAKNDHKKYSLAIRGTEINLDKIKEIVNDFYADFLLGTNRIPTQYFDIIDFVEMKVKPLIYNTKSKTYSKITITGHSLGGFLIQMRTLSYHELFNEIYTYNIPLESKSVA